MGSKNDSHPSLLEQAYRRALGGGVAGVAAQAVQVVSLMWMHTALNHQYKNGTTLRQSVKMLWAEGGIPRFYRGLPFALVLAPATRFVDTASNAGCMEFLNGHTATQDLPLAVKTACGSVVAAGARVALLPLDVVKTVLQVKGTAGWPLLRQKIAVSGGVALFHGGGAAIGSSIISHYPWFLVAAVQYNALDSRLPEGDTLAQKVVRNAGIGLAAATAAATASNWMRVMKTTKQTTARGRITYIKIIRGVVHEQGFLGLATRGLGTKIAINGIQSMLFTVLWKLGQAALMPSDASAASVAEAGKQEAEEE